VIFNTLSDGDALYGRSAFLEPHSAAVAIKKLGRTIRGVLEVTVATEDLEHLVGNETNSVDREQLADCSLLRNVLAFWIEIEVVAEVDDAAAECMDHHLHVSELNADCLTLDDRLTEGYTVASTSDGHFEHALRNTEVRSSNVNTRYSEGVHSNLHAFATLAEHQFWLEFNVGELQTGVAGTTAAHHMRHWYEFETRLVHWYKEGRQTIVALLVRVSYADYVRELRAVSVGDEPLFTIEDPLALFFVPYSGGVKVSTSAARLLGESEVGEDGLVLEERHILLFDFWLTEGQMHSAYAYAYPKDHERTLPVPEGFPSH